MTKNTYAIADLHGRHDLLVEALELIEEHAGPAGGKLVVLGDFIDRGTHSRQIIETLMAGPRLPDWEWVVLQGNHEWIMLETVADFRNLSWWIRNGGHTTLESYGYADGESFLPIRIPEQHLKWLAALPVYHEDDHRIYVHAGVPADQPVAEVKKQTLQWMLYTGDGHHYPGADMHEDLAHMSGKHIVHGHHQSENHPLVLSHRTNLDSFAWYTGNLAIGVFDDSQARPVCFLEARRQAFVGA